jgi:hypothetical protein
MNSQTDENIGMTEKIFFSRASEKYSIFYVCLDYFL